MDKIAEESCTQPVLEKESIDDLVVDFPHPPTVSVLDERKIWRKVDLKLIPIVRLLYFCSYLDRGNIGNARLQGLETQLNLVGNEFNIALTMYYITYCLSELPSNLVLKKLRPSRLLPGITVMFGIITTFKLYEKRYHQLLVCRTLLGIAEAGIFPGIVYYLTLWYPRHKLQFRIGLFYGASSLSGALSGLLAYGIGFMSGVKGLLGWSWIFILEGIVTVLVGVLAFFVMVDFPYSAGFLTPEERAYIVAIKKHDISSVGEEEHFERRHIWEALSDWKLWLHIPIFISVSVPISGITLFLPFGYSVPISQLLTIPPYIITTMLIYAFSYFSDKFKMRSPFIYAGLILSLIGYAINISNAGIGIKYFGTYLCLAGCAGFPGVIAWLGNNIVGHYKRGISLGIYIGIGNFGGAIASNMYRTKDRPRFIFGHALELMFIGIGLSLVPIAVIVYRHVNKAKALAFESQSGQYEENELKEMGDKAPGFRYTL
ncbi:MFS general substrate transporter [Cyathus striatus]|nr:MFS general substrate transporter [Cyathus striatus]